MKSVRRKQPLLAVQVSESNIEPLMFTLRGEIHTNHEGNLELLYSRKGGWGSPDTVAEIGYWIVRENDKHLCFHQKEFEELFEEVSNETN